jgi:nitroreductase
MELYDVMRTTFAVREFTDDPLPDPVLYRILDNARFAPSGGNRQGTHVVAVRDAALCERLAEVNVPGARRYFAQAAADESPWNPIAPSNVPAATIADTAVPDEFTAPFRRAAVVRVITVDLMFVAAMDQHLDRIGMVSGASVYPLVWNILLAARNPRSLIDASCHLRRIRARVSKLFGVLRVRFGVERALTFAGS